MTTERQRPQGAGSLEKAASDRGLAPNLYLPHWVERAAGFVRRHSQPSDRVVRLRVGDDAWDTVVRRRVATLACFRDIAQDGMDLVGPGSARARPLPAACDSDHWLAPLVAVRQQRPSK